LSLQCKDQKIAMLLPSAAIFAEYPALPRSYK
jgi:hypothetical protein